MYFKIGEKDFSSIVSGLKVGYETLVSDSSGRNANGDTVIDVINTKRKIYVNLRYTTVIEMRDFLEAIESYVVEISYLDPKTNNMETATTYTGTPEPEYFNISKSLYKPMSLNFIEL